MTNTELAVYCVLAFFTSILSGISGGGGGFIMTPLGIFFGLTPAQSVSTGKLSGLTVTIGSLAGLKKQWHLASKRKIIPLMVLAFLIGLVVPFVIKTLDQDIYRTLIGSVILGMIPFVIIKKIGVKKHHPVWWQKYVGVALMAVIYFLVGVFSGGIGILLNLVLMSFMGMTALEANLTKRFSQIILNTTVFLGVLTSGLIMWKIAILSSVACFIGGAIGGHMAVKHGDELIMKITILLMFTSGVALILGN